MRNPAIAVIIAFVTVLSLPLHAKTKGAADGGFNTAFQLSLFNPIQIFNENSDVFGIRLTLLYGKIHHIYGVDFGCGLSEATRAFGFAFAPVNIIGRFHGGQMGIVNINGDTAGEQMAVVNVTGGQHGGQIGVVNIARETKGYQLGFFNSVQGLILGTQIGVINVADRGVQVGLINILKSGQMGFFPIVNVGF